jgi:hypothetical protein
VILSYPLAGRPNVLCGRLSIHEKSAGRCCGSGCCRHALSPSQILDASLKSFLAPIDDLLCLSSVEGCEIFHELRLDITFRFFCLIADLLRLHQPKVVELS